MSRRSWANKKRCRRLCISSSRPGKQSRKHCLYSFKFGITWKACNDRDLVLHWASACLENIGLPVSWLSQILVCDCFKSKWFVHLFAPWNLTRPRDGEPSFGQWPEATPFFRPVICHELVHDDRTCRKHLLKMPGHRASSFEFLHAWRVQDAQQASNVSVAYNWNTRWREQEQNAFAWKYCCPSVCRPSWRFAFAAAQSAVVP